MIRPVLILQLGQCSNMHALLLEAAITLRNAGPMTRRMNCINVAWIYRPGTAWRSWWLSTWNWTSSCEETLLKISFKLGLYANMWRK